MMACGAGVRRRLRVSEWGPAAMHMKATTDIRDLGAHLSLHAATRCGAAAERVARALRLIKRLGVLPLDAKNGCWCSKRKLWPMATWVRSHRLAQSTSAAVICPSAEHPPWGAFRTMCAGVGMGIAPGPRITGPDRVHQKGTRPETEG